MPDTITPQPPTPPPLACGHPAAAWIDHPHWGWCGQCAQQAEAALPPARPSRLVREARSPVAATPSPHTLRARLVVRLYADDLCVGASDDPDLWQAVFARLLDAECQRLAAAGEGGG
jgi:hypothetical protein